VWDLKAGTCVHVLQGHVFRIRCLSLNDNILVTGSWDHDLKVRREEYGRGRERGKRKRERGKRRRQEK
jgi:WD40 repeat protein